MYFGFSGPFCASARQFTTISQFAGKARIFFFNHNIVIVRYINIEFSSKNNDNTLKRKYLRLSEPFPLHQEVFLLC